MGRKITPRDNQRKKCYSGQRAAISIYRRESAKVSMDEAVELVDLLWDAYPFPFDIDPPEIRIDNSRSATSCWHDWGWVIQLHPDHGKTPRSVGMGVVIHELAHAVLSAMGVGRQVEWHGPEFVGIYTKLTALYTGEHPKQIRKRWLIEGVKCDLDFCPIESFGENLYRWTRCDYCFRSDTKEDLEWWLSEVRDFSVDPFEDIRPVGAVSEVYPHN